MKVNLDTANIMTFAILILAAIVVAVGGVVVILGNLTFAAYLDDLKQFAIGVGLTAIGRGLAARKTP